MICKPIRFADQSVAPVATVMIPIELNGINIAAMTGDNKP
jgi:hypothetical protein